MARWNTITLIAGVDFSDCQVVMLDAGRFASIYAGSSVPGASGTPHVQRVARGVKGLKFGMQMPFADESLLTDMLEAIQAAEGLAQAFRVRFKNALFDREVWAIPDYSADPWFVPGPESEGIIRDVVIRFEAVALYS